MPYVFIELSKGSDEEIEKGYGVIPIDCVVPFKYYVPLTITNVGIAPMMNFRIMSTKGNILHFRLNGGTEWSKQLMPNEKISVKYFLPSKEKKNSTCVEDVVSLFFVFFTDINRESYNALVVTGIKNSQTTYNYYHNGTKSYENMMKKHSIDFELVRNSYIDSL